MRSCLPVCPVWQTTSKVGHFLNRGFCHFQSDALDLIFGGYLSTKSNSSHFFFIFFYVMCFERGSQLILVVVLPRVSSSSVMFCALCGTAMVVLAHGDVVAHAQGLYVSQFSHAPSQTFWLCMSVQFRSAAP